MKRRVTIAAATVAALFVLSGSAFADEIHTPAVGRTSCGVESGTITVLNPGGPTVAIDGTRVDITGCIPPDTWETIKDAITITIQIDPPPLVGPRI